MLTLDGIAHQYRKGVAVLDGVDLHVEQSQSIAVLGPSGSGKSTLLLIAGLILRPSRGSVSLDGVIPSTRKSMRATRRDQVAWIFQGARLMTERTALDNVRLPLLARGTKMGDATTSALASLQAVSMVDRADDRARQFSGGEMQRIAIARALAVCPRLIVADEPTAQLDRANADAVTESLAHITHTGALLVATHDPKVAAALDVQVELRNGKLE